MKQQIDRIRAKLIATLLSCVLTVSLFTAAIADGPAGLGKILPPCQGTLRSDGSYIYSNGVVLEADKRVSWHDANNTVWTPIRQPDGSWLYLQDGTILYPNGTVTYPPDS
jgi:hypothetical protein